MLQKHSFVSQNAELRQAGPSHRTSLEFCFPMHSVEETTSFLSAEKEYLPESLTNNFIDQSLLDHRIKCKTALGI